MRCAYIHLYALSIFNKDWNGSPKKDGQLQTSAFWSGILDTENSSLHFATQTASPEQSEARNFVFGVSVNDELVIEFGGQVL